jgi:hypothetical protein
MGLFSIIDKDKKDKYIKYTLYRLTSGGKVLFQLNVTIFGLESFLNNALSGPLVQMFWNDVKEKFGKDVDEKELYKVFKFFALMLTFKGLLEAAKDHVLQLRLMSGEKGYFLYRFDGFFDGKLDEKTFKELIEKIWTYYYGEFLEKYKQYKEQKDKQPK